MRLVPALLCFLVCIAVLPAKATDVYTGPQMRIQEKRTPHHEQMQELFSSGNENDLVEALRLNPDGQTLETEAETTRRLASQYFRNCMTSRIKTMSRKAHEMLCACTAGKITEFMNASQIDAMLANTREGKHQRRRLVTLVYTPCMDFPVRNIVRKNCLANTEMRRTLRSYQAVCACLGEEMGRYLSQNKGFITGEMMRGGPESMNPQDILVEFMGTWQYGEYSENSARNCTRKHEFGR